MRIDFDTRTILLEGPDTDADALASLLSDVVHNLMRAATQGDALAARDLAYYMAGVLNGVAVEVIGQPASLRTTSRAKDLA